MKYLKYFESNSDIDVICKKYGIKNYHINEDGTVDVDGDVDLFGDGLTKLPLKFGYVSGNFDCETNKLITLEGAPKEVGGYFDCHSNKLTSLEDAPKKVDGSFHCYNNRLTTLRGGPEKVGGSFTCDYNQLTSLVGSPKEVYGSFDCSHNKLTSLAGAPEEIGTDFDCDDNPLPKEIKDNMEYINKIIKYQSDYNIWRRDGSLDAYRFSDMMKEIMEEK
jgi:hypothetical protein